ncbi:MAG: hypothetical protein ACXVP5_07580 [Tumebacillaceae bacterium]
MSFIVLEDLRKPLPKRRFTFITSIRIVRPLYQFARYTYRGSRFFVQKAIWVVRGDRSDQTAKQGVPKREVETK